MTHFLFPEEVKAYLDNVAGGKMQISSYNIKKEASLDKCFINLTFANAPAAFPAEVQDYLDKIATGNLRVSDYDITRDIQKGEGRMMLILATPLPTMPMIQAYSAQHEIEYPKSLLGDHDRDYDAISVAGPTSSLRPRSEAAEPKDPVARIKEAIEDLREKQSSESESIIAWLLELLKKRDRNSQILETNVAEVEAAAMGAGASAVGVGASAVGVGAAAVGVGAVAVEPAVEPVEKGVVAKSEVEAVAEEAEVVAAGEVGTVAAVEAEKVKPETSVPTEPIALEIEEALLPSIPADTDTPSAVEIEKQVDEEDAVAISRVENDFKFLTDEGSVEEDLVIVETEPTMQINSVSGSFDADVGDVIKAVPIVAEVETPVETPSPHFTPTFQDENNNVADSMIVIDKPKKGNEIPLDADATAAAAAEVPETGGSIKINDPKKSDRQKKGSKGRKTKKEASTTMGIDVEKEDEALIEVAAVDEEVVETGNAAAATAAASEAVVVTEPEAGQPSSAKAGAVDTSSPITDVEKRATIAIGSGISAKGSIMKKKDKKGKKEGDGKKSIVKFNLFGGLFSKNKKAKKEIPNEEVGKEAKAMTLPIRFNDIDKDSEIAASETAEDVVAVVSGGDSAEVKADISDAVPDAADAAQTVADAVADATIAAVEEATGNGVATASVAAEVVANGDVISPEVPFRLQKDKDASVPPAAEVEAA